MADRLIRITTAFTVVAVAIVAAIISYQHAYELVRSHGEFGPTARLVPLTVDGLIYSSSMVLLRCARHRVAVPGLARWLLGLGIAATLAANVAHGLGHGPAGAVVAAWPAVALVGSYELLMMIIREVPQYRAAYPRPGTYPALTRSRYRQPKYSRTISPQSARPRSGLSAPGSTSASHAPSRYAPTSPPSARNSIADGVPRTDRRTIA